MLSSGPFHPTFDAVPGTSPGTARPLAGPELQTPSLSQQSAFEAEIAALIVRAVNLETPPEEIDPTARLFGEGLGLDSIDLLEIALAITQRYGCELRSDDPDNARIFASLRNLAAHVAERRRT